jgi:hypothetical protein
MMFASTVLRAFRGDLGGEIRPLCQKTDWALLTSIA